MEGASTLYRTLTLMEELVEIPEESQNSMLDELLGSFQVDGQLESEGQFSLNPMKALKKLGEFALPRPEAWVLLAVQAAVAAGCQTCEIDVGRTRVDFVLSPAPPIDLHHLVESTLSGNLNLAPELGFLSSLLRICVARSWSLHLFKVTPEEAVGLKLDADALRWEKGEPGEGSALAFSVNRPSDPRVGAEKKELLYQAHLAPLELSLNGQRIDTFDRDHLSSLLGHGREINLSLAASAGSPGFHIPADSPEGLDKQTYEGLALFEARSPKPEVRLNWLRYGVVIKREVVSSGYDVEAHSYIYCDDLETDLSGFDLKQVPLREERRRLGLKLLHDACREAIVNTRAQHEPLSAKRKAIRVAFRNITLSVMGLLTMWWSIGGDGFILTKANWIVFVLATGIKFVGWTLFTTLPVYLFGAFLVRTFIAPPTGLEHTMDDLEILERRLKNLLDQNSPFKHS